MTSLNLSYFSIIFAILFFLVPIAQLLTNTDHKRWFRRITPLGWTSFIVAILYIPFSIININVSASEKTRTDFVTDSTKKSDKRELDSTVKAETNTIIDSFNNGTKKVTYKNNTFVAPNQEPLIILSQVEGANPSIVLNNDDGKLYFTIHIQSSNTNVIHNLQDVNTIIPIIKGKFITVGSTKEGATNETFTLGNFPFKVEYGFSFKGSTSVPDTVIDYLKINYKDNNYKQEQPFRSIYMFNPNKPDQVMYGTSEFDYAKIKKYLIDNKLW